MQIVIDIPEEDYERLKEYKKAPFCSLTSRTYEAIANGVPLPKGHGRLIDADRLKPMHSINRANFNTVVGIQKWVDDAPTIIEADKEEEINEGNN